MVHLFVDTDSIFYQKCLTFLCVTNTFKNGYRQHFIITSYFMIKNSSWAIDDVGHIGTSTLVESSVVKCEVNLWAH